MAELKGIDVHVHPADQDHHHPEAERRREVMARYFGTSGRPNDIGFLAESYRGRQMMAVLLGSDDSTTSGIPPMENSYLADAVNQNPDVFFAFGGVDPWKGQVAVDEVKHIKDLGLHGLKFNPGRQHFEANNLRFYKLWQTASDLGLICLFHTGMMGNGAGAPGGLGFKLKYTAPIPYLDDIAADFPDLNIISAHPGWPWQDEQLAMARHKGNVYIDISGWAPQYFPPQLVQQAGTLLQNKVLFGSDYPVIAVERWLKEFEELPFTPEVRQKIMLDNAKKLFGLK